MQGIFRKYREKRKNGQWSGILYEGIFLNLNPATPVIIARLSHGLRVIQAKADEEYLVVKEYSVEVIDVLVRLARAAYWPDQNLQRALSIYEDTIPQL